MGKEKRRNPHCPVPGCKTKKPHLDSPTTKGVYQAFSNPATLTMLVKASIVEILQSVEDDMGKDRFFAFLTRWRQPEELYYRALYILFIADEAAIPHVVSGELPNSFSDMWTAVNKSVLGSRGTFDKPQLDLNGEMFTVMTTLNSNAHASFATIVTTIGVSKNQEAYRPKIERHVYHWKTLCKNLNHLEKMFNAGKSKSDALLAIINLHDPPIGVSLP